MTEKPCWLIWGEEFPGKEVTEMLYQADDEQIVEKFIDEVCDQAATLRIIELKQITGLGVSKLKEHANNGDIHAACINNNYYVSTAELRRITELSMNYIAFDDVIAPLLGPSDCNFQISRQRDRNNLLEFISGNAWWGIPTYKSGTFPLNAKIFGLLLERKNSASMQEHIQLWIAGYDKLNLEKSQLLLKENETRFPKTCRAIQRHINSADSACSFNQHAVVDFLDALFEVLPAELEAMTEEEIEVIIIARFKSASLVSSGILTDLLYDCEFTQKQYVFNKTGYHPDTSSYSLEAFATMVYTVLISDAWEKESLVQKALENKRFADLWLYLALHIFCAWRTTDSERVLSPSLKYTPEETLRRISAGAYTEEDSRYVAQYFIAQIQALAMRPHKTQELRNVSELYFYCPKRYLCPFGTILSIATAHHVLDNRAAVFVNKVSDIYSIRMFFGEAFATACGNSRFSTRRANKTLMQSVDFIATDDNSGLPVPYILASIMRSHKGGYGRIAETTAIYLKDANFTGYTPKFIAYQMLERGVCSFAVDALMEICYGEKYMQLSIPAQTQLIKSVGIPVASLDHMLRFVQTAEDNAIEVVREITTKEPRKIAQEALNSIALGHPVGKDAESLCLRKAAGQQCFEPGRLNCLGCRYEIKTKALLMRYLANHLKLQAELKDPSIATLEMEVERRQYALQKIIFPAITEIVTQLKGQLSQDDFLSYQKIAGEVLHYGN